MILTNFENLNYVSNIFHKTHGFLVLTDPVIVYIKNHRQRFSWSTERPPSYLKVTKMWFGPNIKYFSESFFADICCRDGISSWTVKLLRVNPDFG